MLQWVVDVVKLGEYPNHRINDTLDAIVGKNGWIESLGPGG